MTTFSELGLAEPFLQAAEEIGYETPTPIQKQAIPVVLAGRDLIGCAQTGTGKTAAFTMPMLDRLMQTKPPRRQATAEVTKESSNKSNRPKPRLLRALVLSPTRELAAQIGDSLEKYGQFTPIRHTVVYGGISQVRQVKALRHGVDALVATPGRLLDLMGQGHVNLSDVEILVLDEADQMLDMGFLPALRRIVAAVPEQRQTLLFSATMPDQIRRLAKHWLRDPVSLEAAPAATPSDRISQSVYLVDKKRKHDLLVELLRRDRGARTLVFSRTKRGADIVAKRLAKGGFHAASIHGNKSQGARMRALALFKGDRPPILVATDVAARGLDVRDIKRVVNFDLPDVAETYVHRIGRTARAGAEGAAVSFCSGDEHGLLRQIERLVKRSLQVMPSLEGFEPTEPVQRAAAVAGRRTRQGGGRGGGPGQGPRAGGRSHGKSQRRSATELNSSSDASGGSSRRRKKGGLKPIRTAAESQAGAAGSSAPRRRKRRPVMG